MLDKWLFVAAIFFFQAEDGIRDAQESRGLGDVYKRQTLDLRPVYHRKDQRIEAQVFLCFLALMLVRIAERKTNLTWDRIRTKMERLHRIEFLSKDGRFLQTTEPTPEQLNIFKSLKIPPPKRIQGIQNTPKIHRHTTQN